MQPGETLAFLTFINDLNIELHFADLYNILPSYFVRNLDALNFEDMCLAYYFLKKEEHLLVDDELSTDEQLHAHSMNVIREYIKIIYSQMISSSKVRSPIPAESNFYKILTVVDLQQLLSHSR